MDTILENTFSIDISSDEPSQISEMFNKIERVLPEQLINEFDGISQMEDKLQWNKGDLTNQIWQNVLAKKLKNKHGNPYTFLDICYYVSVRFLRGSKNFNTVKAWALVSRRYSPAVRQLYHYDEIDFAHFTYAACRKFEIDSSTGQKLWQDVLDYSWELSQSQGRAASVKQLEQRFEGTRSTKSQFKPTLNDFNTREIDIGGVEISQIADVPVDSATLEAEFAEVLHRLSGLVFRFANKYPRISGSVTNAYSVLSNALASIVGVQEPQD